MSTTERRLERRWDIFCRLVDNMGDIGVCWRLARALALYHGRGVRLWVDDVEAWRRLYPGVPGNDGCIVADKVEIRCWREPFPSTDCADVVVEAFACDPPPTYVEAMASRSPAPLWINLEYLTAESWIDDVHGMASPHPRLPLVKHFFFPGFSPVSGGLLREPDLFAERDRFQADTSEMAIFLSELGCSEVDARAMRVSLFAYEQAGMPSLMGVWASGGKPVHLIIPEGRVVADVARFFDRGSMSAGEQACRGALSVSVLPFLSQQDYDRLLWCCDLNFVRGEDSFVRAQWAAKPFVWQVYRQDDGAHRLKLLAFLERYLGDAEVSLSAPVRDFCLAWNGHGDLVTSWSALLSAMPAWAEHGRDWASALASRDDLATALVKLEEVSVK